MKPGFRRFLPDGRTRLLGIIGDPIEHSLSPALHTSVLRLLDRNLIYVPFPVSEERLGGFLREAPAMGVIGLNVTTPFKQTVVRHVRPSDIETARTGVINTIRFGAESAEGLCTDGAGILNWLRERRLSRRPFGVLGFGATARSVVHRALAEAQPLAAIVTRRPEETTRALARWSYATRVVGWSDAASARSLPSLWISTLPPDAAPEEAFWRALPPRSVLLDLNYGRGRTGVADAARFHGVRAAGGLGPLCHQAALSLSVWLGSSVPVRLFYEVSGAVPDSLRPVL